MNAAQDRSNDPNIGERVLWLAQVSAAATALAGTRVPDQFNGTTETSKAAVEPVTKAKLRSLTAQRDDSSNPNVRRATSPVRSSLTVVIVSGLLVILAVAALPLSGRYTLADAWQQLLSDYTSKLVPMSSLSATWTSVISSEPARPRLDRSAIARDPGRTRTAWFVDSGTGRWRDHPYRASGAWDGIHSGKRVGVEQLGNSGK